MIDVDGPVPTAASEGGISSRGLSISGHWISAHRDYVHGYDPSLTVLIRGAVDRAIEIVRTPKLARHIRTIVKRLIGLVAVRTGATASECPWVAFNIVFDLGNIRF